MGEALSGEVIMSLAWREAWQPLVRDICCLICDDGDHRINRASAGNDEDEDQPSLDLEEGQGLIAFHQPQSSPAARLLPTTPVHAATTVGIDTNLLEGSGASQACLEATAAVSRESHLSLIEHLTTSLVSTHR